MHRANLSRRKRRLNRHNGKSVLFFDDRHYAAQGAQKLLLQLATFARDAGLQVTVGSTRDGSFLELARSNGLETIVFGVPDELDVFEGALIKKGIWRSVFPLAKQNFRLLKIVRAQGFSVVWIAAFRPVLSMLAVAGLPNVKLVWQVMGSGYFRGLNEVASLAANRIVLIADGLRPVVGAFASRRPVKAKIRIVETGVKPPSDESSTRLTIQSELQLAENLLDRVWVVSIGAHIAEKGHLDVLHAVEQLPPDVSSQVLLLIGGPPIEGSYGDQLAEAAKVSPIDVSLHGWVSDVDGWLRASDIYVVASTREGMPLTTIEAMQRSTACIGYPVGGIPELLAHGETGMIVPTGSIDALTQAISSLVRDRDLLTSIADNARELSMKEHSDEAMRSRFEAVLREMFPNLDRGGPV